MVSVPDNPFNPAVLANPYPMYDLLRAEDPVHWSERMETWVVTRYDEVVTVLSDSRFSANRRQAQSRFAREALRRLGGYGPLGRVVTMLGADPPEHTRLRRLVSKAFTPRRVELMRPHIQEIVDGLLDVVRGSRRLDIIHDLAYPLPVIVIAEMLGVPPEDRDAFKRWSDDIVGNIVAILGGSSMSAVPERGQRSLLELAGYLQGVIEERRREPKLDLLSALIAAEEQGQVLNQEELLATAMLLLVAGSETTTNLIGNGMLALLRHPDQLLKLRATPSLMPRAVEELLRYDSPVQATSRMAREDLELGGRRVRKGNPVLAMLAAANRDPAHFDRPDELDISRQPNEHLSFGAGPHSCLGLALGRAQGEIAIQTLLRRIPNPHLEDEDLQWGGSFALRGLKSLPIVF